MKSNTGCVDFFERRGKWRARITIEGVSHFLGYHKSERRAETALKDFLARRKKY